MSLMTHPLAVGMGYFGNVQSSMIDDDTALITVTFNTLSDFSLHSQKKILLIKFCRNLLGTFEGFSYA